LDKQNLNLVKSSPMSSGITNNVSTSLSNVLSNIKKKKKKIEITFEDLQHNFEFPIKEAAVNLHVSLTQLKRICRDHDIPRWPHRKVFFFSQLTPSQSYKVFNTRLKT
jgi:hypothetical protein